MKKMILMSVMTMFLSVFMVAACGGSKDKDDPTPQQNEMEKKLIGEWKEVSNTIYDSKGNIVENIKRDCQFIGFSDNNVYYIFIYLTPNCERKDEAKYVVNGTYKRNNYSLHYSIKNIEKKIDFELDATIIKLTDNELEVEVILTDEYRKYLNIPSNIIKGLTKYIRVK